ncbi:MAG: flippase-like domain-containing protein [Clostridiales bacterium]|nr:flippase-like domain-containing protein [Clostridiales bacterium]
MKKKLIKSFLYLLAVIAFAFIMIKTDWKEVYLHIRSISPKIIVLLLLSQCFTILLLSLQWRSMSLKVKQGVSFWDILMVNAKGNIVDAITPGVKAGGELARVYELRKRLKIKFGHATIIVGLQKTMSLLSFLFMTLSSLIWFSLTISNQYKKYLYVFSFVIAIFAILLAFLVLFSLNPTSIIKPLKKMFSASKIMPKIDRALREYSKIVRSLLQDKRKFFSQMILALFIWVFYSFKLLLVMKGLAIDMDLISIAAITFLTYIMGMIPILPGSIGSFEGSMLVLLGIKGVPMEVGLSVAFIFRFITFWFEFIISCFIVLLDKVLLFPRKGDENFEVRM